MTSGVTTRLQRKSRNTTSRSSNNSSAAASAAESQTTNSISNTTARSTVSTVPLPTVTVNVGSSMQNQEVVKDEVDPLCIRSMPETTSSSPALTVNPSNTRRVSSNGNQSNEATTFTSKIKVDPDGDVAMKTEPDSNWSSYPLNGLMKHEIKTEEIKQEEKSSSNDAVMKDDNSQSKDEKKVEVKKENDDKENEDGKHFSAPLSISMSNSQSFPISVKNKNSSVMEINDDEWNDVEAR